MATSHPMAQSCQLAVKYTGPKVGSRKQCRLVAEGSSRQSPGAAITKTPGPSIPCPPDMFPMEQQVELGIPGHIKLN